MNAIGVQTEFPARFPPSIVEQAGNHREIAGQDIPVNGDEIPGTHVIGKRSPFARRSYWQATQRREDLLYEPGFVESGLHRTAWRRKKTPGGVTTPAFFTIRVSNPCLFGSRGGSKSLRGHRVVPRMIEQWRQ